MTRKDYELIASVLCSFAPLTTPAPINRTVEAVADLFALRLKLDNPRFDADTFIAAAYQTPRERSAA